MADNTGSSESTLAGCASSPEDHRLEGVDIPYTEITEIEDNDGEVDNLTDEDLLKDEEVRAFIEGERGKKG